MGFNPWLTDPNPCWTCHHFDGMTAQGSAALCKNPRGSRVRALPEHGCSSWEREPGADDEVRRPTLPLSGE